MPGVGVIVGDGELVGVGVRVRVVVGDCVGVEVKEAVIVGVREAVGVMVGVCVEVASSAERAPKAPDLLAFLSGNNRPTITPAVNSNNPPRAMNPHRIAA
jgi:hypothetical protein